MEDKFFQKYNDISKEITHFIKQENFPLALEKLNECLEIAPNLSDSHKWYVETAYRKIRLLIKYNKLDELIKFKEESNLIIKKYGSDPFHKWSIAKHLKSLSLIDEYVAYRTLIKSFEKLLLSYSLINEEMVRQDRLKELKEDQKNFFSEIIETIEQHGYKIKSKSELKNMTQKNYSELMNLQLFTALLEIISFPVLIR